MTTKCCTKQLLISAFAVFLVSMGMNWLVHGNLLMDMYKETANLWRSEAEMQSFFPLCLLPTAILSLLIAGAYKCHRKHQDACITGAPSCHYQDSVCFGLWLGAFMGTIAASAYFYLPVSASLAFAWFAAEFIKGIIIGIALKFTYCRKDATTV